MKLVLYSFSNLNHNILIVIFLFILWLLSSVFFFSFIYFYFLSPSIDGGYRPIITSLCLLSLLKKKKASFRVLDYVYTFCIIFRMTSYMTLFDSSSLWTRKICSFYLFIYLLKKVKNISEITDVDLLRVKIE